MNYYLKIIITRMLMIMNTRMNVVFDIMELSKNDRAMYVVGVIG